MYRRHICLSYVQMCHMYKRMWFKFLVKLFARFHSYFTDQYTSPLFFFSNLVKFAFSYFKIFFFWGEGGRAWVVSKDEWDSGDYLFFKLLILLQLFIFNQNTYRCRLIVVLSDHSHIFTFLTFRFSFPLTKFGSENFKMLFFSQF